MADETRKIILQLEVDQAKSISQIVTLKDRIAQLKTEQKSLNLETTDGKKTFEAYNAQIKALTKEQRSLENAVSQTAGAMEYENGSIAANRAELSRLTAEYKNLANPTAEQTKRIKDLSDKLKQQEAAIGNTSRNVGNYKEALMGIQAQLGVFGPQIQQLTQGFQATTQGVQLAVKGFSTLKGALATTGIGLILIAFGTLLTYFKETDEGATKLEGIMGGLGAVMKEVSGVAAEIGGRLFDVITGAETLQSALSDLGDFLLNNLINRFKAFLVLGEAIGQAFNGDFSQATRTALNATIQFTSGIEDGLGTAQKYAEQLAAAAKQAFEYAIKLDAINDAQRALNITNAKSDQIVQQLIISAKNKTLTDQQRIDLLEKANKIEEQSTAKQLSLDKERLALIKERNKRETDAINQKLERDILEAKSEEKKIALRQKSLSINDKLAQEQADLEEKIIRSETSFILLREKNQNKIDVLNEQIAADRAKMEAEHLKRIKEINDIENSLEVERQSRVIANIDYELSKTSITFDRRIELLKQKSQEEDNLRKTIFDQRLSELDRASQEENANIEAIELQKIALYEKYNQEQLAGERKLADDIVAINAAAEKKKTDDALREAETRKKQRDQDFQDANKAVNDAANFFINVNQAKLDSFIISNEKARKKELAAAGTDKKKQDIINKKFDKLEEDEKRKAARTDLDIKTIQAIATTALGVTQALGSAPPPLNFVLAALTAAAGAVQIGNLQAQKAKLADGGLLKGPSHSMGGITGTGRFGNIEVEGGEFVVNKKATREHFGLLTQINASKNRNPVRFGKMAAGGLLFDGGLSSRSNTGAIQSEATLKNLLVETISRQPNPVVLVKDINNGQGRNVEVKDRARVTR